MIRHATDRLLAAVLLSAAGLIVAVLGGEPGAAVLVTPWAILLILGLANSQSDRVDLEVSVGESRLLVGDEVEVTTTVEGLSGSLMVSCVPSDGFWPDPAGDGQGQARLYDMLVPGRTKLPVSLRTTQWGVHDLGHVEATVTEPYGLFRQTGKVDEPRYVRVHPAPTQVQNLLPPWLVRRVTGVHSSTQVGRGVEYADIRPFASGDSLGEINWKATARSSELWVSSRHPDRATDVVLLLDSFVESGHDVRTVFGLAIEGAVALAESHLSVADRVGLVELGGTVRWLNPRAGRHQLQRITDHLLATGLHSHVADRNLALLMSRALTPRSFVVALTPLLDDRFIDALFIVAAHGHDVGVIECAASKPEADDGADTAHRLAERLWEMERQVIRDRLAENGVAIATWRQGDHLDLTLVELTRLRRIAVRGRRR